MLLRDCGGFHDIQNHETGPRENIHKPSAYYQHLPCIIAFWKFQIVREEFSNKKIAPHQTPPNPTQPGPPSSGINRGRVDHWVYHRKLMVFKIEFLTVAHNNNQLKTYILVILYILFLTIFSLLIILEPNFSPTCITIERFLVFFGSP